jgi:hypothetical protein
MAICLGCGLFGHKLHSEKVRRRVGVAPLEDGQKESLHSDSTQPLSILPDGRIATIQFSLSPETSWQDWSCESPLPDNIPRLLVFTESDKAAMAKVIVA